MLTLIILLYKYFLILNTIKKYIIEMKRVLGQIDINDPEKKVEFKQLYLLKYYKRSIRFNKKEFKIICNSYIIFTKFCGHSLPYLVNFNKLFLKVGAFVWFFDLHKSQRYFKRTRMSVAIWLLLNFFLNSFKKRKYDDYLFNTINVGYIIFICRFYRFLMYLVCKKILLINYKSLKKFIAIWPKMFYTDAFLFDIADTEKYDFANCQILKIKKSSNQTPHYDFVIEKLKNFKFKTIKKQKKIKYKKLFSIKSLLLNFVENNLKYFFFKKKTILFLRKQKCFNKGRYSRNRQLYRTGVYWCLYLNIAALLGLNFLFYKFTINFSYYWWIFYIFINTLVVPLFFKYRLYNYRVLLQIFSYVSYFVSYFISLFFEILPFFAHFKLVLFWIKSCIINFKDFPVNWYKTFIS